MFLQQLPSDQSMSRAAMNLLPLLLAAAVLKQVLHQNSSDLGSGKSWQIRINILQKVAQRILGNFFWIKAELQ